MFSRKVSTVLLFALVISLMPNVLLAETQNYTVPTLASPVESAAIQISVAANDYPENQPGKLVPDSYVNMYSVVPVIAGVYEGKLIETKEAHPSAVFTVMPGQIVDFVTFRDAIKAKYTRHWTFQSPPYKNFNNKFCQINFLDKDTPLESSSCSSLGVTSKSNPLSDQYVVIAAADKDPNDKWADFEVWVQQTSNPLTVVKDAEVYLYDAATQELMGKGNTGNRGNVKFIVEKERKFFYAASKGEVKYGGYKTQYTDTPRVFMIEASGNSIKNPFDNSRSYVLRLNAYPNYQLSNLEPVTQPVLQPVESVETPRILEPAPYEVLTAYPRVAKLAWSSVPGASNYEVAVYCDICGSAKWTAVGKPILTKNTYLTTEALPGDNTFRYQVRALAADGERGPWSAFGYFSFKTKPPTVSVLPQEYVNLSYRYYRQGLNEPEKGNITLVLSSDFSKRGYNFEEKKYASVAGGAFYITDSNAEKLAKFYGNNVGQGGLIDLGAVAIDSVKPVIDPLKYNRYGLNVYKGHTYAVYDELNKTYALIYVESASLRVEPTLSYTVPAPVPVPVPVPVPSIEEPAEPVAVPTTVVPIEFTITTPVVIDDDDDFVEIVWGVDFKLVDATLLYGKKKSNNMKGFKIKYTLDNTSEDIQQVFVDVKCDAALDNGSDKVPLVNYIGSHSQKPGLKKYSKFYSLQNEKSEIVEKLQKTGGKVYCSFAVSGIRDFTTGALMADSNNENDRIDAEFHWKYGKFRMNSNKRVE